jgi:hypothetical protein
MLEPLNTELSPWKAASDKKPRPEEEWAPFRDVQQTSKREPGEHCCDMSSSHVFTRSIARRYSQKMLSEGQCFIADREPSQGCSMLALTMYQ